MKKITLLILFIMILITSCSIIDDNNDDILVIKKENEELNKQIKLLEDDNSLLELKYDELKDKSSERNKLNDSINMTNFSAMTRLIFEPIEQLNEVYSIKPDYEVMNDWYLLNKDDIEIELVGYKDAKSVKFYIIRLETDAGHILLYEDNNASDKWLYKTKQFSSFTDITDDVYFALYAEVMYQNGEVIRTPILPFYFQE